MSLTLSFPSQGLHQVKGSRAQQGKYIYIRQVHAKNVLLTGKINQFSFDIETTDNTMLWN